MDVPLERKSIVARSVVEKQKVTDYGMTRRIDSFSGTSTSGQALPFVFARSHSLP